MKNQAKIVSKCGESIQLRQLQWRGPACRLASRWVCDVVVDFVGRRILQSRVHQLISSRRGKRYTVFTLFQIVTR